MNRYKETVQKIRHNGHGKRRWETMYYPTFEKRNSDIYIMTKRMERLDLLANEYYGDPRLWWVISRSNTHIPKGTFQIPPGKRLRIPNPLTVLTVLEELQNSQFD